MRVINKAAEDHFLNFLETFSRREVGDQRGLLAQYFELSNARASLRGNPTTEHIERDLTNLNSRVEDFVTKARSALAGVRNTHCYVFHDGTVLIRQSRKMIIRNRCWMCFSAISARISLVRLAIIWPQAAWVMNSASWPMTN